MGESPSMAQIQNKQNRDQQYLAVRVNRQQHPLSMDTHSNTYKTESADYIEDICPYATFQLNKPAYSESSYSGNVYSGPYHSVRGSFVYHDVKPPPQDKFRMTHVSKLDKMIGGWRIACKMMDAEFGDCAWLNALLSWFHKRFKTVTFTSFFH